MGELPTRRTYPGGTTTSLCTEAARLAIADAGLRKEDVDGLITRGSDVSPMDLAEYMGLHVGFCEGVTQHGSSGAHAVVVAAAAIHAGLAHTVLCVCGGTRDPAVGGFGPGVTRGMPPASKGSAFEAPFGLAPGANTGYALLKRRHMYEFGTTEEQLALVASKNHAHSVHNPKAMYRKEIAPEEILASRSIVDPLRLLMLCTPNEGAAAAILTVGPARAGEVRLLGQGLKTAARTQAIGEHMPTDSPIADDVSVTRRAALQAFERAGVGPEDLDVIELQDTDAGTEIIATEQLGLCGVGEGGALAESGATRLGGRLPVNPSGGLLSKGEPVGASALGQAYEIANQLRGRCGARQVPGARTGLTHALGAGGNCSVLVLQRA